MTSATNIPVHVKKNRTAGDWAILILLIVGGLVMLFPFIVLLLNAFKTTADYNSSGPLSWPKEFSTVGLMKFWNRVNYSRKAVEQHLDFRPRGHPRRGAVHVQRICARYRTSQGPSLDRSCLSCIANSCRGMPCCTRCTSFKKIGLYNSPWAIVIIFTVIQSAFGTYLLSSVYGTFPKPYWKRRLSTAQVVGPSSVR